LSLLFLPGVISNLNPAEWHSTKLYVFFSLSTVSVIIIQIIELFAATRLLLRRNQANVVFLRYTLYALAVASALALLIDITFFQEEGMWIYFDSVTLIFAIIWALYFWKSKRVRLVFIERNWNYETQATKRILSPDEKKYRNKRVIIVSIVVFTALFILFGLSMGERKPDWSIFALPAFYAILAGIIAWFLPVKRQIVIMTEPNQTVNNRDSNDNIS